MTSWRSRHELRELRTEQRLTLAQVAARTTIDVSTLEGHDWIYVQGRMRLVLGAADLVIAPGEAVEFSTWTPHWFGAVDEAVEMILILGPEGAHEHLHRA